MAISAASLAGRIALVTGGASGIGRAVCVAFAQEGARCVVADRNISDAQRTQHILEKGKKTYIYIILQVCFQQSFSLH